MEIVYERVAAIDVGKKIIAVAVRTPGEQPGKRRQQVRKFNTYYQTLVEMVAWLTSEGCCQAGDDLVLAGCSRR